LQSDGSAQTFDAMPSALEPSTATEPGSLREPATVVLDGNAQRGGNAQAELDGGELGPTVTVGGASDGSDIVGNSGGGNIFTQRIYTHYLTTSSGGPVNLSSSFSDLAQP
jgi:hypothetical protein